MQAESRKRLAASQAALVRSLALNAAPPDGFHPLRIAAAADGLISKRARLVAHAWPRLARSLGESFIKRFATYARETTLPLEGSPLLDGRRFARALDGAGVLPEEGKLELLAVDARYVLRGDVLARRRGFTIKAVWLKQHRRISIVIRLPLAGERWLELRVPRLLLSSKPHCSGQ